MSEIVEKIAERYSDELVRVFPVQNIVSVVFLTLILCMANFGDYLTAVESAFRISINDLLDSSTKLKGITLGMASSSFCIVILANVVHGKLAHAISIFLLNGYDLDNLSSKLYGKSKEISLPVDIAITLANACSERLNAKKSRLKRLSSLGEFLLAFALCELVISIFWFNVYDLMYFTLLLFLWVCINLWLVVRFVSEILPLEAHVFGLRGVPYDVGTTLNEL